MRKTYRPHFKDKKVDFSRYPLNEKIKSPEVRVIDETGQNLGVMPTAQAITTARERGHDLVAVFPNANPPVAKFLDYGKFKYQQEKENQKAKAKQKKVNIKTVKISARIGQHDLEIRRKRATKFLEEGNKVKIELRLRGREHQHVDLAKELINNFIKSLQEERKIAVEAELERQGSTLSVTIRPN